MLNDEISRVRLGKDVDSKKVILNSTIDKVLLEIFSKLNKDNLKWTASFSHFPKDVSIYLIKKESESLYYCNYKFTVRSQNKDVIVNIEKLDPITELVKDSVDELIKEIAETKGEKEKLRIIREIPFLIFKNNMNCPPSFKFDKKTIDIFKNFGLTLHVKEGDNWLSIVNNPNKIIFSKKIDNKIVAIYGDGSIRELESN